MNMLRMKRGFTLIELLVVIGVLAVIAAGVVALINPLEKNRQAQDARVFSDIGQMSSAIQAIAATTVDGAYPCAVAAANCVNPTTSMVAYLGSGANASGELNSVPTAPAGSTYIYLANATPRPTAFQIYGALLSLKYDSQCSAGMGGTQAWYVFDSAVGRACIECRGANPAAYAALTCDIVL